MAGVYPLVYRDSVWLRSPSCERGQHARCGYPEWLACGCPHHRNPAWQASAPAPTLSSPVSSYCLMGRVNGHKACNGRVGQMKNQLRCACPHHGRNASR